MNTSRSLFQRFSLLAGGLLLSLSAGFAAPGGGGAVGVGTASAGGGHSAAPVAAAHTSGTGGGLHSSVGVSGGFRSGFGGSAGVSGYQRGGYASGGVRTLPNIASNPRVLGEYNGQSARIAQAYAAARVNNAWSEPSNSRVAASGINRYGGYAASTQRNGLANDARSGSSLTPGTTGYVPTRPANGHFQHGQYGNSGSRGNHRYYYNNFPYAVYYPYLYGGYGYGDYGDPGYYNGSADFGGLSPDANVTDPGTPNFSDTPNNYYSYTGPGQDNPNAGPNTPTQTLPDAPVVGPQDPSSTDKSAGPAQQGPDSLVEAVQDELSKRGYLEGKPDAVYTPATKEAIRRFQTDNHLPATGRINEATLHALHLD